MIKPLALLGISRSLKPERAPTLPMPFSHTGGCGSHFSLPREPQIKCSSSFMGPGLGKEQDRRASGVEKYFVLKSRVFKVSLIFPLEEASAEAPEEALCPRPQWSDRNEVAWAKLVRMWKSMCLCEKADSPPAAPSKPQQACCEACQVGPGKQHISF